ncbi:inositol monophosphatase family protein [Marinobacter sp. X15-166B]|uniref:inositol monophosphatase family protein n=1 Tax=Marinobacter sp. X15-166B TaxID=1897620 RepID=UPI00085C71EF|nr:inositol monophosphatase family protein [Marinobacter sp. X15-166B]OEY67370.1 inositol monophosphatase [Marinobacter sp. X15-166B]
MQPAIKMALRVARQGSDYLKAHFERQEPANKGSDEQRQQLDRAELSIYESFAEQLQKAYRDHVVAPMNEVDAGTAEKSWHIFPLLGRDNFVNGIPDFAVALIQKRDNRTENLLLTNPITGEEYAASRGQGAILNSRRGRTSNVRQLDQAAIVTNVLDQCKLADDPLTWAEVASTLARSSGSLRTSGCTALDIARVATGFLDAAVVVRPQAEDLTIALAIAQESGALTGDFVGNPSSLQSKQLVVANPRLFKEILRELQLFRGRLPN